MDNRAARGWHLLTAVATTVAVVLQLVLVVRGGQVLQDVAPPGLGYRLYRFAAYFTIESNALVAVTTTRLALHPREDGAGWRVARLAGVVGIAVTGVVHFVLLRPLLDLQGPDWLADKALHMVVPALAVVGWAVFGPRPRVARREVGLALAWPVGWVVWTLVVGALSGWYPYPFLDHRLHGTGPVAAACVGVTALFLAVFAVVAVADRRLSPAPGAP